MPDARHSIEKKNILRNFYNNILDEFNFDEFKSERLITKFMLLQVFVIFN